MTAGAAMPPVDQQIVLVTGAASGLGRAVMDQLLSRGSKVVAVDLPGWREGVGARPSLLVLEGDVRQRDLHARIAEETTEAFGDSPHSIVNNAAILVPGDALSTTDEQWWEHLDINVRAAWLAIQQLTPRMIERGAGAIVNVVSIEGLHVGDRHFAYAVSKGALRQLSRSVAHDLGPHGVRCNSLSPGAFETPMLRRHLELDDDPAAAWARVANMTPLRRLGAPAEFAALVEMLISPAGGYLNGADIVVDGGRTLRT